jgi:hypothetical protein
MKRPALRCMLTWAAVALAACGSVELADRASHELDRQAPAATAATRIAQAHFGPDARFVRPRHRFPGYALDLVAFTGITGPLTSALTQIAALGPGIKALVGFVGFVVALISLSALRNFGPVLFYVGLAIFAAVGLVIAGAIMGAVI